MSAGGSELRAFDERFKAAQRHLAAMRSVPALHEAQQTRLELVARWPAVVQQVERAAIWVALKALQGTELPDVAHDAIAALDDLQQQASPFFDYGGSAVIVRRWLYLSLPDVACFDVVAFANEDTVETTPCTHS